MDAIIDCLYEEPREGVIKDDTGKAPWLRNDESVRSGSIMFTFRIGRKSIVLHEPEPVPEKEL